MSLQDVQARAAGLQARIDSLRGGTPLTGGAGGVMGAGRAEFAAALSEAKAAVSPTTERTATPVSGQAAVDLAEQHLGTPYVFGGSQPGGFDCSGLVQWTYAQLGVELPRHSTEQGKAGIEVSAADARPGDLVYFDRPGSVDHIGIYRGHGTWVVAPKTGDVVKIQDVDLSKATSIRRVVGAAPSNAPAALRTTASAAPAGDWAAALPPQGRQYAGAIASAAAEAGIDPRLLSAVAWTESGFRADATSGAGAQGLMQIMPRTAAGLGVDATDPVQALQGGARYLKQQLDAFGGRADLALAAYNAGPTAVRRAGGVPDYTETKQYVDRVLTRYSQLGGAA